ncbi:hypothetical protein [Arcanobacterium buesumense]|uniref:Uncharacterized protein n=1 Tax=Arcanobacterium buesumense TaxID=2722751 RepID=A0A6H2ELK4_9ACTO|nr:hypothetical protein [Arcanobacterium buesumense]QJC21954.1 hypothetical protein HC352_05180 [Arcanobacterium buesumense]
MTIDLNVSRKALTYTPHERTERVYGEHTTSAWLGIDLSMLGVQNYVSSCISQPEPFQHGKMMAATRAAASGGLDFVALSAEFCADASRPQAVLDAINVGAQMRTIDGSGVVMEVLPEPKIVAQALDAVCVEGSGWASLAIRIDQNVDLVNTVAAFEAICEAGVGLVVNLASASPSAEMMEIVAQYANMVRLQVADPHTARGIRYGLRALARDAERDLPVVVDLGVVISATSSAAHERAILVSEITGCELFSGIPTVYGTVYDVADTIERWVGLGAADGVVIHPASLPIDLASLVRGVLPLLSGRAGVEVKQQSLV